MCQIRIYPKKHQCSFENINQNELKALAQILKYISVKLYTNLKDAPFDLYINSNNSQIYDKSFHLNIEITPRLSYDAGFEYSTGVMVNTVSPESAKKYL